MADRKDEGWNTINQGESGQGGKPHELVVDSRVRRKTITRKKRRVGCGTRGRPG